MSIAITIGAVWLTAAILLVIVFHHVKHPRSAWDDIV